MKSSYCETSKGGMEDTSKDEKLRRSLDQHEKWMGAIGGVGRSGCLPAMVILVFILPVALEVLFIGFAGGMAAAAGLNSMGAPEFMLWVVGIAAAPVAIWLFARAFAFRAVAWPLIPVLALWYPAWFSTGFGNSGLRDLGAFFSGLQTAPLHTVGLIWAHRGVGEGIFLAFVYLLSCGAHFMFHRTLALHRAWKVWRLKPGV